jgi:NAD(P)-dependent dehydrogenase (short-subunit alcohol dehydrogenase family)
VGQAACHGLTGDQSLPDLQFSKAFPLCIHAKGRRMDPQEKSPQGKLAEHEHLLQQVENLDAPDVRKGIDNALQEPDPLASKLRDYPKPPMPSRHLEKPGLESELDLKPMYDAPHYRGSGKLDGLVALITGGDSGIGRATAVLFAREGASVAIVYLDEDSDAATTEQAVNREGQRCVLIRGDVRDAAFCRSAVERTVAQLGRLDVLVNNAAYQQHVERLEDLTEEQFDTTLRTNLYGYFHMAKAAVPYMKEGSSIIMTGSVTAFDGSKHLLDYSMTKGGIHSFTRSLSSQLADRGIRVNAVAPGPVWTPLNPADATPEKLKQFGAHTAFRRPAQPEEISPAFVFLAAPSCSSFITGEVLPVIGGYT